MRVLRRSSEVPGRWSYDLVASPTEDLVEHGRRTFEIDLPPEVTISSPAHPDAQALAVLLVVRPYAVSEVVLPEAVSVPFAAAVQRHLGLSVGPVDPHLEVRAAPDHGRPGLAFSAGVDSIAALTLLPETTCSYFLQRRTPPGAPHSVLTVEAATAACVALEELGRDVRIIPSDLEFIRPSAGFPEHYANAVPALLCSELDQLDAISWGMVAESAYGIGKTRFEGFLSRRGNARWHALFAVAGLPMLVPTLGISEVGTTAIALDGPYGHLAGSCVRGSADGPCLRCWKCFRKGILEAAHSGRWPDDELLDRQFHSYSVRLALSSLPIKHEVSLSWALGGYSGSHELLRLLARRVRAGADDVGFLEGWYEPATETWPEPYRASVAARIDARWPTMDGEQQRRFESYDLGPRLLEEEERVFTAAFVRLVDAHAMRFGDGSRVKRVVAHPLSPAQVAAAAFEPAADVDVEALRKRIEAFETSTSYRLGHAITRAAAPIARRLRHGPN